MGHDSYPDRAGGGGTDATLRRLGDELERREQPRPPFTALRMRCVPVPARPSRPRCSGTRSGRPWTRPDAWTLRTLPRRLKTSGDPWQDISSHARTLGAPRRSLDEILEDAGSAFSTAASV